MQFIFGFIAAVLVLMNWDKVQPVLLNVLEYLTNLIN